MPSNNIAMVRQFSGAPALLSAAHADALVTLATGPAYSAEAHAAHQQQLAASYGLASVDDKPYLQVDKAAVIPVWGVLLHRGSWCTPYATGYGYLSNAIEAALRDESVESIVFDMNSCGGHVAGNFELAARIREAGTTKPTVAIVDSRALSGSYSLAAACGKIIATPSSDIGSIGVVLTHMSLEGALEQHGIKVTFVHAGKHKVDGNPYEDLPDGVRQDLQASVDESYEAFVALVAEYRGIDAAAVRGTEARVFGAAEAKRLGLVDEVMPARAAYASVTPGASASAHQPREVTKMTDVTKAEADQQAQQAAAAERTRVSGILQHAEAEGRGAMANHLAFNTSMSVEEAASLLATAPKESKQAAAPSTPTAGPLAAAMADDANKTVGVDNVDKTADTPKGADRLMAAYAAAGGVLKN